jgi:mannose-6-phosphate isomerase-like protein (cupin superfamily)
VVNPGAEEVLYVAGGEGKCRINGFAYAIGPGAAIFVPPGAVYSIENTSAETMRLVGSCCPEDPLRHIVDGPLPAASGEPPRLLVHEDLREDIRAGQDRLFRYLVYTDLGCQQITQFAGWIPPSKAPVHYHAYEEGIYILDGHGIVHTDDESCEFGAGSSIYFPIGVRHCVENPGTSTIKLLGAFYPSGSPGEAYEAGEA